jgi:hypothetical protein
MEAFGTACASLFAKGRVYASHIQLDQVADLFLKSWGVKKTHPGQTIRCFFSPSIHKKTRQLYDQTKRRKVECSPKHQVSCPFKICYSLLGKDKQAREDKTPKIFHHVKIATTCFEHTCNPSTTSHRMAIQKSGSAMPELAAIQGIMNLLRRRPTIHARDLRPMLVDHIPWFKPTDTKFVGNFRRKAVQFFMANPVGTPLSHSDMLDLTKNSAANERTVEDSPLSRTNLQEILRTVMQEGSDIWDAMALLNRYKDLTPGLDYRIRYHPVTSRPEAVCWMLPEMKADAARYADIMFLDASKRDMNNLGWPYIGPCIKDNENKVRVVSECLCIAETIENYSWVLGSMAEMSPHFRLKSSE